MSLRRFFVDPQAVSAGQVILADEIIHHIRKVLRLATGSEVLILDGLGHHHRCRIDVLGIGQGTAEILESWFESEKCLPVRLIQSLPKGEKFDLILQKGSELGVSRFSPVWSERSVPVMNGQRSEKKHQRWQRITSEAARQSQRPILPVCDPIVSLDEALADCQQELRLMLWEEESRPLVDLLPPDAPVDAAILVGPEGGFSENEAEKARSSGFQPVSLGPRILRTETAGFAVTAVLEYLYGDFGSDDSATT